MTYLTDEDRWSAIERRDRAAEGAFFCAVKTTGVYCLPSCQGRPLRRNVTFYDRADAAQAAGYRACKLCKPDVPREHLRYATTRTDLGAALAAQQVASGSNDARITAAKADLDRLVGMFPTASAPEQPTPAGQLSAQASRVELALS